MTQLQRSVHNVNNLWNLDAVDQDMELKAHTLEMVKDFSKLKIFAFFHAKLEALCVLEL